MAVSAEQLADTVHSGLRDWSKTRNMPDNDVLQEMFLMAGEIIGEQIRNMDQLFDTEALVCQDIQTRQKHGLAKYGVTVAQNPLELRQWLQHAYEECLDQAVYLKRAIAEVEAKPQ